jgi:hypothetical protein
LNATYCLRSFLSTLIQEYSTNGKEKAKWIGHILRRNRLLEHYIERKLEVRMEVTRKRGRRRKQLLDDLKEKRGRCIMKEEILDHTLRRTRFGRGYGPVVRQMKR